MRGLAAHSNGFQTVRSLAVLMSSWAPSTRPAAFGTRRPYPRHIVPNYRAFNDPAMIKPNTPLNSRAAGLSGQP